MAMRAFWRAPPRFGTRSTGRRATSTPTISSASPSSSRCSPSSPRSAAPDGLLLRLARRRARVLRQIGEGGLQLRVVVGADQLVLDRRRIIHVAFLRHVGLVIVVRRLLAALRRI